MKLISGKVFRRYALSYLSIVLIISSLLGIVLQGISASELKRSEGEIYESRLVMAASHIERQLSAMQVIRLKVKTNTAFMPFYLKQHIYNDRVLLESFAQYAQFSDWAQEYYLWYADTSKVYSQNGTCGLDILVEHLLKLPSQNMLNDLMREAGDMGISFAMIGDAEKELLVCLPMHFNTEDDGRKGCMLLFAVPMRRIRQELAAMTNVHDSSQFTLTFDGKPIVSAEMDQPVAAYATGGHVMLALDYSCFSTSDTVNSHNSLNLLATIAILAVGACLALFLAYRNYRPIHSLYSKYARNGAPPTNELQTIEALLVNNQEDILEARKQMDEQLRLLETQQAYLKQQMVMMLISGTNSPVISRQISDMGYDMSHALYVIIFMHLVKGKTTGDLIRDIEASSDEEYSLYAAELQREREYAVLVNFDDEERIHDLLDLMSDILSVHNLTARLQISCPCHSLSDIALVAIKALNARFIQLPAPDNDTKAEDQNEQSMEHVLALAEAGKRQQAIAQLDVIITVTNNRYPSYIMRIYILNTFMQRIHGYAIEHGMADVPEATTGMTDPEQLAERMRQMIQYISAQKERGEPEDAYQGGEVAAYIREHCLDVDISLLSIAEVMGISTKQVSRLLRNEIDKSFKEYLVELRMEHAKRLLRDEALPIADVAERIGYVNVSYFIKSFKDYMGVTPGKWRQQG